MDCGQRQAIFNREIELREKKRIIKQLDIAESFFYAYSGAQPSFKGKRNIAYNNFIKWRRNKLKELNPNLKQPTIWDKIKKSCKVE